MDLFEFLFLFFIIVVPTLAIFARAALKPMVEAIIQLREAFTSHPAGTPVEQRVVELEEQVKELRQTVHELKEIEAFHRELLASHEPREARTTVHPEVEALSRST